MTNPKKTAKATKADVEKMIDEVVKKDVEALRVRSKVKAGVQCLHCHLCRQG
jgi:hypothetical protein